jgi:serine/threonine-protein kinase
MSPEQIKSEKIDRRSDIFAAGVVLWELLAGRRLFRATNDAQTIRNVIVGDIPDIRTLRPEVPAELADAVRWALERDPARRPQWASELSEHLQGALIASGYTNAQRQLVDYMAETYGGSHPGEPIFRRR